MSITGNVSNEGIWADNSRFPNGRSRTDPAHFKMLCLPGEVPSRSEVANMKR